MRNHLATITFYTIICLSTINASADSASMFAKFRNFLTDETLTDFTLVSADGSKHPCHRLILAGRGSYWEKMLTNGMKESKVGNVTLEYSQQAIKTILSLFYNPDKKLVGPISLKLYLELLEFANMTDDKDLKNAIEKISLCSEDIDVTTATAALEFAVLHNDENLIERVFNIIKAKRVDDAPFNLISYIEKENPLVISALRKIRSSNLFKELWKTNNELFLKVKLETSISVEHVLAMKDWSKEEAKEL